jgi:hypothetical protein
MCPARGCIRVSAPGMSSSVALASTPTLPPRERSLAGVDRGYANVPEESREFIMTARRVFESGSSPVELHGFVHGDLWQGNVLWEGDDLTGIVDWDFAGVGPAGVDLGSLRADAAVMYGVEAADEVLAGWEHARGERAQNVAWYDLVAGLSTPPDMGGWLPNFNAQGRTDLDVATVTARRNAMLEAALRALG